MNAIIKPFLPKGKVTLPASKSISHRALLLSAMTREKVVLSPFSKNDDIVATMGVLSALGVAFEEKNGKLTVDGKGFLGGEFDGVLDCKLSASTLRFFMPFALLTKNGLSFTGKESLLKRSQTPFMEFCQKYNFVFEEKGKEIFIKGSLQKGEYEIDCNLSSQFASGLLMALSCLEVGSTLKVVGKASFSYLLMTLKMLEKFGFIWTLQEDVFTFVEKKQNGIGNFEIEGDASTLALFSAWQTLGCKIDIQNMPKSDLQGDIHAREYFEHLKDGFAILDITNIPDLAPMLFAFAYKKGAGFRGVKRLTEKECDRLSCMRKMLFDFGVVTELDEDLLIVHPCKKLSMPKREIDTQHDHRMVFAGVFLASIVGGTIDNTECVSKSYPNFWKDILGLVKRNAITLL